MDDAFDQPEEQQRQHEAEDRRDQQGSQDAPDLVPIDAVAEPAAVNQGVLDRNADEGADQRVGTGVRQPEQPSPDVPGQRRHEQSRQHPDRDAAVGWREHIGWNEFDQGISDRDAAQDDAEEVHEPGPDHGRHGLERMGVDDGRDGVRGVVEAVRELEDQDQQQASEQEGDRRG